MTPKRNPPTGVGLGLRTPFLHRVLKGEADGRVAFLEISPENVMHRGGRVPTKLAAVAQRFPILTHGLMMSLGGTDPFDDTYFKTLREFLDRHDPPWHSDHLCFSGLDGVLLHDLLPVPFTTATAKRIAARIREASDRLERPMAFENISWYLELGVSQMDEAEFIGEVAQRADCGLLLDVNNCFVNARNHGFDLQAWLDKIPYERVWQLHVAGHERYEDTLWLDTHGAPIHDTVYEVLDTVLRRTGPVPVLLERDNNIPPLAELLDEVARVQAVYDKAVEAS